MASDVFQKIGDNKIVKYIMNNVYIKNILLMIAFLIVLIGISLLALNIYTKHNSTVRVPELKGMQAQDAFAITKSSKLNCEVVDSIYKEGGKPGSILEQIPHSNTKVKEGRTIYLTVQSYNEPMVAIPDLVDASLRQSETLLSTLGFTNVTIEYIPSEFRDLVYSVESRGIKLKAGQKLPKSTPITIKVGDGGGSVSDSLMMIEPNNASGIEDTF
jgi:beta-lactam-binding protein with PASTA domain